MTSSTIDSSQPASHSSLSSAPIRSNFAAAYSDINNLWNSVDILDGNITDYIFTGDNTGATNVASGIQNILNATGGVCLLPTGTYLITSQLTKPSSGSKFVLRALGNGPVVIKHNIDNKAIFIDNTSNASAAVSVSSITSVTDNTQDYVSELAVASLPTGASRGKYCAVYCSDLHLGEKTYQIASIVKTTGTSCTVTTNRAHGLTAGSAKVLIYYATGMTEINSTTPYTIASVPDSTSMVITTSNNAAWGAYTANSGFAVAATDYGFLGEGSQIMETESTKIRLYGVLKQASRMVNNIEVRVVDDSFKVHIEGIEFQPNGNPFASTTRTIFDCVEIIACIGAILRNITFTNSWSIGMRLRSCMNCDIDNINFEGAMNKISSVAFGYGLALYGMNYAHKIGRIGIKQLRHGLTCGTSQGSAFSSSTWYNLGYNRKVEFNEVTTYNSNGTTFDTHEPAADFHYKNLTLIGGFNGPEDESSVGGGYSCRGIDESIDTLTIIGCRTGAYVQLTDHGMANTFSIGNLYMQGHPQADDSDVCLRTYDAAGVSNPVNVRVGNMVVKDVGRAIQKGIGTTIEVGNINTVGVDIVALVYGGGSLVVWGSQFYDFSQNPFNQPAHYCYLLYSDATNGGGKCYLMTSPTIKKGDSAAKPTELFTEQDTNAAKYYWLPETGIYELNPSAVTSVLLTESGATTLNKETTITARFKSFRIAANTAGVGAPRVLLAGESGSTWTNEGAAAKNYYTLPLAQIGLEYRFIVQDADGMRIKANTDDTIRISGSASVSAGYVETSAIGAMINLTSINNVEWVATAITGVWTVS